jgi:hypothetical protein
MMSGTGGYQHGLTPQLADVEFWSDVLCYKRGLGSPKAIPNLAAWYDIADLSSLTYDGSNRVSLVADKSGNSGSIAFVSDGAASNTATTATKSITGNQTMTFDIAATDWTPAANYTLFSKLNGNSGLEVLLLTTGVIRVRVGDGSAITNFDSNAANTLTDLTRHTLVITYVDNASVAFTIDGTALGTTVTVNKILADGSATATIGTGFAGRIYRARIGSLYDFNPAASARMAASVTDGVSGTWTINTSGATGARICGERDLYQGTVANQPVLTTGARPYLTFDGSNDYLKAAPFSLSQPETVYFVGSQVSWTINDVLLDGGSASTMRLSQQGTTPSVSFYAGSSFIGVGAAWAVATQACVSVLFQSPNGKGRVNRGAQATGDPGNASASGFTLGARADGSAAGNITASEVAIYAAAHNSVTQSQMINYEMTRWGIS